MGKLISPTFPNHSWHVSVYKGESSLILREAPAWVDNVVQIADFIEANVLRHRFCNSGWFNKVFDWQEKHTKDVYTFPLTPDQVKKIAPDTWDIFYWDDYEDTSGS